MNLHEIYEHCIGEDKFIIHVYEVNDQGQEKIEWYDTNGWYRKVDYWTEHDNIRYKQLPLELWLLSVMKGKYEPK